MVLKPDCLEIHPNADKQGHILKIRFTSTKTHFGNARYWLQCPGCQRQCCALYLRKIPKKTSLFLCRTCLNLAYRSQNRTSLGRVIDKKWDLIQKYKGDSEWSIQKPKGMHEKTFDRIRGEIQGLRKMAMKKITEMFGNTYEL